MNPAFWIILTGSLVAVSCAILGTFLLLRKMSMVGDAISHAVLPGIVIAFLISGSTSEIPALIGAAFFGILTTVLIEAFHVKGKMQTDAAIGISFTFLFAVGVILVSYYAGHVHIDQECVLYGEIAFIPFDVSLPIGAVEVPKSVVILSIVCLMVIAMISIGYRGFFITTFDPGYAAAIGISTIIWNYILMAGVSLVTVVSFESVGAILVVAFLIVPAAAANLLTDNLKVMLLLASLLGIISAIGGYYLAVYINGSIAGSMAVVTGIEFFFAFFLSPSRGILIRKLKKVSIPGFYNKEQKSVKEVR